MGIEKMTENDAKEVAKLVNGCYRGDGSLEGWTSEAAFIDGIRTSPENIIGCVYCHKQGDELHSGMLCVNPKIQNQGLGKKIMGHVERFAKDENCSVIKIDVITIRDTLIAWYKRLGFKETGKLTPFPPPEVGVGIAKIPLKFVEMEKHVP